MHSNYNSLGVLPMSQRESWKFEWNAPRGRQGCPGGCCKGNTANPLPAFQNSLPVLPLVSCPWPGLPCSARFVSCKRAKDHGRSEALCSQTARIPAGTYLSGMDYGLSPASCLYASASQQGLAEHLLEPSCVPGDWRAATR